MKIKTKLSLSVGFLFLLIILLIGVSINYINAISKDTQNILVANYNTIDYARQMLIALDEDLAEPKTIKRFEENLIKQQSNVTEVGEKELTTQLTNDFNKLKQNVSDVSVLRTIRKSLADIMLLNMQAIQRKSTIAESTAKNATTIIAITGTFCFLLAFILLLNLPGSIANPIKELTESIKEIAARNYSKRVNFESHNEFGDLAKSFNTMAEKLEEYNSSILAKLLMEKKRIEILINKMHNPVIGLDENKKVLFINNEALKITGLKQEETIGKSAKEIIKTNDLMKNLIADLDPSNAQPSAANTPLKIYADNKESFFEKEIIKIEITPTAETDAKYIGDVILLQNITAYKELDFAKTNFIATVSHELKTPIASMLMSLQLLENEKIGGINAEQKNLLLNIKDDTSRLLKITGELLNMTQVETGNIQLSILPADPKEILHYAINANKTKADQKQIKFEIDCSDGIPKVLADNEKTAWVLTNLISNAIRYSYDDSTIILTVKEIGNQVQFSVRDTGQGIAPQYKEKIFDRYFRIPGTKKEGTGLGLSISKEFIEAQGGQIALESEYGAGSTFSVTLNKLV